MDVQVFESRDGALVVASSECVERFRNHPLLYGIGEGCISLNAVSDDLAERLTREGCAVAQRSDIRVVLGAIKCWAKPALPNLA